jgi:hypothetical protein
MWKLDDWHDLIRLVAAVASIISLYLLAARRVNSRDDWSAKTNDLWWAMVAWCVTGVALPIEGILEDRHFEPRPVFYLIASLITLRGVWRRGHWGGRDEKLQRTR